VIIDGVWIGELDFIDLLYISFDLQTIAVLLLIFPLYKSPQHLPSLFQPAVSSPDVPWQRLLTVEILQLHALTPLLSGEYPATELKSAGLGSSLYSLGADLTENTASNSFYIIVMGGCLAIDRVLLTCFPAVTKQRMFLLAIVV
jgi:hypothetical protein